MYKKDKTLTEISEKRLRAIKEFTEFGSASRSPCVIWSFVAPGILLGTEQSGHMLNIGYELYCKMLEEAVDKARGIEEIPGSGRNGIQSADPCDPFGTLH